MKVFVIVSDGCSDCNSVRVTTCLKISFQLFRSQFQLKFVLIAILQSVEHQETMEAKNCSLMKWLLLIRASSR